MDASRRAATLFRTPLGWFGLAWSDEELTRVTFGHTTKAAARSELAYVESGRTTLSNRLSPRQRELVQQLSDYADGAAVDFRNVRLKPHEGTRFQRQILHNCRQIRWGQTQTYGQLAAQAGSPRAARAAGTVMAKNRFPIIIPCHRVIASNYRMGGFSAPGGVRMKQRLLELESG